MDTTFLRIFVNTDRCFYPSWVEAETIFFPAALINLSAQESGQPIFTNLLGRLEIRFLDFVHF